MRVSTLVRGATILLLSLLVIVGLALMATQTAPFRNWARGLAERQATRLIDGEISIGSLEGNLFTGATLRDVTIRQDGRVIITIPQTTVRYDVRRLIGVDLALTDVAVTRPSILLLHGDQGWRIGSLLKRRTGAPPSRRTLVIEALSVVNGTVTIEEQHAADHRRTELPGRFDNLNAALALAAGRGQIELTFSRAAFLTSSPTLDVRALSGRLVNGNGVLQLSRFAIRTAHSVIDMDGTWYTAEQPRRLQATLSASPLNIDEFAAYIPAYAGRALTPTFMATLEGSSQALDTDVVFSEPSIGSIRSKAIVDLQAEGGIPVRGEATVERVNLAPLFRTDAVTSRLNATTSFDLRVVTPLSPESVSGRATIHTRQSEFAGYRYDSIDGDVSLRGRQFTVAVDTKAYGSAARATGTIGILRTGVAYDLSGRISNADLRRLPQQLRLPALESRIAGAYAAVGLGSRLDEGTLEFDASTIEGIRIDAGSRGRISLSGATPAYAFEGDVANVDLRRVGRVFALQFLDNDRFVSQLAGHVALDGSGNSLETLRLSADATVEPSRLFDTELRSASIHADIENRRLSTAGTGEFASLDPSWWTGRDELKGSIAGRFDVRSAGVPLGDTLTLDDISIDGSVDLEPSTIATLDIDSATLEGRLADGTGEITSLTITGPQLEATASGPVAFGNAGTSNLTYHVVHGRIEELAPLVGRDIAGRLRLDGVLTGNRARLASTGTTTLAPIRLDTTFDALELSSTFDVSILDLTPATLRASANIDSLLVTIAGRTLRSVNADVTYADSELEFKSTVTEGGRTAAAAGRLVTLADAREVRVETLSLEAEGIAWTSTPGRGFTARYETTGLVTLHDLVLTSGTQRLTADGSISVQPGVEGRLTLGAEQVDLTALGTAFLVTRSLGGILNGAGSVTGDSAHRLIEGKVAVANGLVEGFTFESLDASLRATGGRVGVEMLLRQMPGAELTASGEVPLSYTGAGANEPLDLRVESKGIDLAIIDAATAATQNATGQLVVDLHVGGTAAAPQMNGSLKVVDGAFTVAATGTAYSSAALDLQFEGDFMRVNTLRMLDDDGERLEGSGGVRVEGRRVQWLDLTLQANQFKVLANELGDLSIDATMNVYGTLLAPKVAGLVRVHDGRLEVDALVDRFTSNAYALPSPEPGAASDVPESTSQVGPTVDLTVQVPGNLILRGRDIRPADSTVALGDVNVTVGGDFSITQNPGGAPVLFGTVTAVRGTYGFQGRRFELLRDGTIAFRGERPVDPALNLEAERTVSGIVAHVNINGTMRSPALTLSSQPPLEEADILSLILFNQPVNRLASSQRDALGERAVSLASGFIASPISDTLEHALDIDLFELETVTDSGSPAITLGEQIGDRLFVKFRQIFGAQDASEVQLEYQLNDILRLQTSFSEGAGRANRTLTRRVERGGIDLVVFFSY
jgi:autotransporter translocation and assembly factor TamB